MPSPSTAIRLNPFKGSDGPNGEPLAWNEHARILHERPNFTLDPLFHAGCYYVQDSSAMYVGYIFRKYLCLLYGNGALGIEKSAVQTKGTVMADGAKGKSELLVEVNSRAKAKGIGEHSGSIRVLDLCAAPGGKSSDIACSLRERFGSNFLLVSNEVMKGRVGILQDNLARWGEGGGLGNVVVTNADPALFGRGMSGYFDVVLADVPCSGEGMFRKDPGAVRDWSPALVDLCAARQKRILADVWPCLRQGGLLIYSTCTYQDKENDQNLEWAAQNLGGQIIEPQNEFSSYGVRQTKYGNLLIAGEVPGEGQWVGALRKTASAVVDKKPSLPYTLSPQEADKVLSISYTPEYPVVELSKEDALKYLHKDALYLPSAPKGLIIVAYRSHLLGLAKNLGTRCNNLLPKGRRILMDV